jgi:hypothetical protein
VSKLPKNIPSIAHELPGQAHLAREKKSRHRNPTEKSSYGCKERSH